MPISRAIEIGMLYYRYVSGPGSKYIFKDFFFLSIVCHDGVSTSHITLKQTQSIPIIEAVDY